MAMPATRDFASEMRSLCEQILGIAACDDASRRVLANFVGEFIHASDWQACELERRTGNVLADALLDRADEIDCDTIAGAWGRRHSRISAAAGCSRSASRR